MSLSQQQILDHIQNLRLGEIQHLVKALEQTLGVSAAAPIAQVVRPDPEPEPEPPPKTEFDVVLNSYGAKKIAVIRAIRTLTGLGIREARDLVDAAPVVVKPAVDADAAREIQATLEAAGAEVAIK